MPELRPSCPALDELIRTLPQAPGMVADELARGMERAVLVLEREVVRRTPTNKVTTGGRLRNAINSVVERLAAGVRGIVGVANVLYARWVEEGTRPHVIRAKPGKVLAWRPVGGFRLVNRDGKLLRGRALYIARARGLSEPVSLGVRQAIRQRAAAGVSERRLARDWQMSLSDIRTIAGTVPRRLTTNRAQASWAFATKVHHPGTQPVRMFRDGMRAALPELERIFGGVLTRVTRRLAQ